MVKKNLMPSLWKGASVPVREGDSTLNSFQQRMNDLFDDFFHGFNLASPGVLDECVGAFRPSIDVKEGEKEIVVKAELPGLEEKDIEVLLSDDTLTIKGEKKEEKEDKGKNYYHLERSYGSFHRVIPLPAEVESNKVAATFKNGVLSIVLPKTERARVTGKKITIKTE
jgi:HSP20 family protein